MCELAGFLCLLLRERFFFRLSSSLLGGGAFARCPFLVAFLDEPFARLGYQHTEPIDLVLPIQEPTRAPNSMNAPAADFQHLLAQAIPVAGCFR